MKVLKDERKASDKEITHKFTVDTPVRLEVLIDLVDVYNIPKNAFVDVGFRSNAFFKSNYVITFSWFPRKDNA